MGQKILIIEDNEQDQKIMKKHLQAAGHEDIVFAGTVREGWEKAKTENPALILVDTLLPDGNGVDACRKLKEFEEVTAKIIVMTGQIDAIDAVKARDAGADDYVVKTADGVLLLAAVKNNL